MQTEKKQTIPYLQWLRAAAAVAVVVMHTEGEVWFSIPHTSAPWRVLTLYDGLVRWPVILFIMITGALFLPRRTSLSAVLKRYIPRLMVAWVFWSGVYALLALAGGAAPADAWLKFITGEYHMWYIPFLCGLYLTIPFLQRIAEDDRLTLQLLAAAGVIGLGIPWTADLTVLLFPGWSGLVRSIEGSLNFSFFFDHLAILLLGHWLHSHELPRWARHLLYAAGIAGLLLTGPATIWASGRAGLQNSLFCDIAAPNNLCTAAALFVFAKRHLHRLPKAVAHLARCSFGVYLSHVLIIELLAQAGITALTGDPVWMLPVLSAAVLAVSWAVSAILGHIPVLGRYLA